MKRFRQIMYYLLEMLRQTTSSKYERKSYENNHIFFCNFGTLKMFAVMCGNPSVTVADILQNRRTQCKQYEHSSQIVKHTQENCVENCVTNVLTNQKQLFFSFIFFYFTNYFNNCLSPD